MLLTRYNNIEFVLSLEFEDGIDLILKAVEQKQEDLIMQRWITHYQSEISYEEFKSKLGVMNTTDNKSEAEILSDVKEILDSFKG